MHLRVISSQKIRSNLELHLSPGIQLKPLLISFYCFDLTALCAGVKVDSVFGIPYYVKVRRLLEHRQVQALPSLSQHMLRGNSQVWIMNIEALTAAITLVINGNDLIILLGFGIVLRFRTCTVHNWFEAAAEDIH